MLTGWTGAAAAALVQPRLLPTPHNAMPAGFPRGPAPCAAEPPDPRREKRIQMGWSKTAKKQAQESLNHCKDLQGDPRFPHQRSCSASSVLPSVSAASLGADTPQKEV